MLKLYPAQLHAQLNRKLQAVYLLLGNDPFLLQESQNAVRRTAIMQGFSEHHNIQIDNNTDWQAIFSLCQVVSLFASRQTLMLILPEKGPDKIINEQLATLVGLLHDDLLLIIYGNKLTKMQKKASWLTKIASQAVLVTCQTPEQRQMPKWIAARARQYNLRLDEPASQLLSCYYEGNLLALVQVMDLLSLLWPDGDLTLPRVEQVVNNTAHFTPYHWIDALLTAKNKRALYILQQLRLEGSEITILLRALQRELLLLITLKRQLVLTPLSKLFDKYHVWQNRHNITTEAINRLSHDQIFQAVHLLTQAEMALKQDCGQSIWDILENLSFLLCHKAPLGDVFVGG